MSAGIIWYRIRSVDQDGKSVVSGTRMIRISGNSERGFGLILYPNPVIRELSITIPANWQNKMLIYEIVNSDGKVLSRLQRTNSSQTEILNMQSIAPGSYYVLVKCGGMILSEKLNKL